MVQEDREAGGLATGAAIDARQRIVGVVVCDLQRRVDHAQVPAADPVRRPFAVLAARQIGWNGAAPTRPTEGAGAVGVAPLGVCLELVRVLPDRLREPGAIGAVRLSRRAGDLLVREWGDELAEPFRIGRDRVGRDRDKDLAGCVLGTEVEGAAEAEPRPLQGEDRGARGACDRRSRVGRFVVDDYQLGGGSGALPRERVEARLDPLGLVPGGTITLTVVAICGDYSMQEG